MTIAFDSFLRGHLASFSTASNKTMLRARQQAPERWIKPDELLNCEPVDKVWLNPENVQLRKMQAVAQA